MATKLKNLVITKVALVDEGSCSDAHIKLYKRKPEGGSVMNFEEILKSLPEAQQVVIRTEITKAKAMLPEGAMSADDAKKLEADKKAAEAKVAAGVAKQKSDEEILKSANLAPEVRALVESALTKSKATEIMLAKMREEQEVGAIVAKTKELSNIPEVDTKVLDFCKSIKGVEGAVDTFMDIMKSADSLIAKGGAFKEVGSNSTDAGATDSSDAAWAAIEKAAEGLVVKGKVTESQAIQMVCDSQPELYNAYMNALRSE